MLVKEIENEKRISSSRSARLWDFSCLSVEQDHSPLIWGSHASPRTLAIWGTRTSEGAAFLV